MINPLAYVGIPTFGRAPQASITSFEADVAIYGVPYDGGSGFRPGTRFGPRALREMSLRFPFFAGGESVGYYDVGRGRHVLKGVRVVDCGDADIVYLDTEYNFDQIRSGVAAIRKEKALPIVLGGDHSITFPVLQAFSNEEELTIVHFDAHLDYRDEFKGVKYGHGSPMRRAAELTYVTDIVSIGLRGLRVQADDLRQALVGKVRVVSFEQIRRSGLEAALAALPRGRRCYVTVDIDVLDLGLCPGVGTPEPGGLDPWELNLLLSAVAESNEVVGFDIVEVNPLFDPVGTTALTAAEMIVRFLGAVFS